MAEKEYGLDILINDENWLIRAAIASKNYGLNKLINDSNPSVRLEVAKQGYGLDILINDIDPFIRNTVIEYCKKHSQKKKYKNILLLNNI